LLLNYSFQRATAYSISIYA